VHRDCIRRVTSSLVHIRRGAWLDVEFAARLSQKLGGASTWHAGRGT